MQLYLAIKLMHISLHQLLSEYNFTSRRCLLNWVFYWPKKGQVCSDPATMPQFSGKNHVFYLPFGKERYKIYYLIHFFVPAYQHSERQHSIDIRSRTCLNPSSTKDLLYDLGKLFILSMSQLPHLSNGDNIVPISPSCYEDLITLVRLLSNAWHIVNKYLLNTLNK